MVGGDQNMEGKK